ILISMRSCTGIVAKIILYLIVALKASFFNGDASLVGAFVPRRSHATGGFSRSNFGRLPHHIPLI
uniref:C2H2-type domain-containing protein n=1 Tax=Parascaris univalens TaxID=6257 RepID=A0A915A4P1_PARUN